ncbi:hypothetical protein BLNAU_5768 [Blattamonas nauphoetae]|uniref:PH domain-containing protein n=1 Tax=Blattamonas nauphoetae TaxID=2049346 RepID=A0ABQ9Y688_9EUKA|nr:hypothetical protein BLNAU_5768 [Blattamonas nauphoetae]
MDVEGGLTALVEVAQEVMGPQFKTTFDTITSEPFLKSSERDELIEQLRDANFFIAFETDDRNGKWICNECAKKAREEREELEREKQWEKEREERERKEQEREERKREKEEREEREREEREREEEEREEREREEQEREEREREEREREEEEREEREREEREREEEEREEREREEQEREEREREEQEREEQEREEREREEREQNSRLIPLTGPLRIISSSFFETGSTRIFELTNEVLVGEPIDNDDDACFCSFLFSRSQKKPVTIPVSDIVSVRSVPQSESKQTSVFEMVTKDHGKMRIDAFNPRQRDEWLKSITYVTTITPRV